MVAVGRIVGRVEFQEDPLGSSALAPLSHVELPERPSDAQASPSVGGVLKTRDRRLARQVPLGLWQRAASQLEQSVVPKGIRVVLVLVTARYLKDPLADQPHQRMSHRRAPPLGDVRGDRFAQ